MVAIIDYGVGNLFSLTSSFAAIGEEVTVTGDPAVIKAADRLLLPGVGAFEEATAKLHNSGMDAAVKEALADGKYVMGICLGMQMLFEKSLEYGVHKGLGLLKGEVVPLEGYIPDDFKIPHIGWNALRFHGEKDPLFKYVNEGDHVYFVHSYYARGCEESLIADTEYGAWVTAAVRKDTLIGCQFHPEKSGKVGLGILKAFCELEDGR